MPNAITASGLTIWTFDEIVSNIKNGTAQFPGLFAIYGPDINVDANSPDGQFITIFAQSALDILEFLQQIYNSFDPDQAIGVPLNQRCAINGVVRRAGTFTVQTITVVTSAAVTLQGEDGAVPFTVQDNTGNKYVLVDTFNAPSAGSYDLTFNAALLGAVQSLPNTITTIVSTLLGVVSVNNPTGPDSVGVPEETDYALRLRRQQSVQLPNQGYLAGLIAALIAIPTVVQAIVLENNTASTDANGIPSHSIWAIVDSGEDEGTDDDAIALAIYNKRNAGCGMKGTITVNVTQPDGSTMPIKFSRPTPQNLWLSFDLSSTAGGSVDPAYVRQQILNMITYGIGQQADVTTIVAFIRALLSNAVVSDEGVSDDNVTYVALLDTATVDSQFTLSAARIIINGVPG